MVKTIDTPEERQRFTERLLADLKALERLLEAGTLESQAQRIGAEQELDFVSTRNWRPAPIEMAVLEQSAEPALTTEFARFTLEINVDPLPLQGDCLRRLRANLEQRLEQVRRRAREHEADIALTGILPSIRRSDITPEALTPAPRYRALVDAVQRRRGDGYEYHITGLDELVTRDNLVLFGGCFTSFQVHLQVPAERLAAAFNWAQAIAGPQLAAATNAPLLLGKRLWHETRVALFEQTTDFRRPHEHQPGRPPRVLFGHDWVRQSILEVFREDVVQQRAYLALEEAEDSLARLEAGEVPELEALRFHNGTIYRWNRPCYGITDGKPHLRIENRVLPAGPTVEDELANGAFWWGMLCGLSDQHEDLPQRMPFSAAKQNFFKAAQLGLGVQFEWLDGRQVPAEELILGELLPAARRGLAQAGVDAADTDHYLGIIEARVASGRTGSQWLLDSFADLRRQHPVEEAVVALTAAMVQRQNGGQPVHTWPPAAVAEAGAWKRRGRLVEQVMSTDLCTVEADDALDLAIHAMAWKDIGHLPVVDEAGTLVGLVSRPALIRLLAEKGPKPLESMTVRQAMLTQVPSVPPGTPLEQALGMMIDQHLSAMAVVEDGRLVGLVTQHDLLKATRGLLAELSEREESDEAAQPGDGNDD